jgi:hypothetical protein
MKATLPIYAAIARTAAWRPHSDFLGCRMDRLCSLAELLPRGNGINIGPYIYGDQSSARKIIIGLDFQHKDDFGQHVRWTAHQIIISPSLDYEFILRIDGINYNDIHSHLRDLFAVALRQRVELTNDGRFYTLVKELTYANA